MDECVSPKNKCTAVDANEQEIRDPFLSSPNSRFNPSTNITLPSELLPELLTIHRRSSRRKLVYVAIFFAVFVITGLVMVGVTYALPECKRFDSRCSITRTILCLVGYLISGIFGFSFVIVYCILSCIINAETNSFKLGEDEDQRIVWQITGEDWSRFIEYIYGPSRQWREEPCAPSFCCRRKTYERLRDRQYGHIILNKNGFIIDELYLVSFSINPLVRAELVNFGDDSQRQMLRMHIILTSGRHRSTVYFDLLPPSSVTQEQLKTLLQRYSKSNA